MSSKCCDPITSVHEATNRQIHSGEPIQRHLASNPPASASLLQRNTCTSMESMPYSLELSPIASGIWFQYTYPRQRRLRQVPKSQHHSTPSAKFTLRQAHSSLETEPTVLRSLSRCSNSSLRKARERCLRAMIEPPTKVPKAPCRPVNVAVKTESVITRSISHRHTPDATALWDQHAPHEHPLPSAAPQVMGGGALPRECPQVHNT